MGEWDEVTSVDDFSREKGFTLSPTFGEQGMTGALCAGCLDN
jgi:hypothetical protein